MRGTDFNRYGKYLDYFITDDLSNIGFESGVSYYWYISKIFDFYKTPILISEIYVEPIITTSIQVGNYILFLIGLLGIYKLFIDLGYKTHEILKILIIVSLFIPLIGARIILKPEIMVFALLPWVYYFYNNYFKNEKVIYLISTIPIISTLLVLKSSITLMVSLSILIIYKKKLFNFKFISINLITLLALGFLLIENYNVNGNYLWDHIVNDSYKEKAPLSYLYLLNPIELFKNPFRNSLSNSMVSILLADTFGDYWQRYWFHKDGWAGENYPGNLKTIQASIVFSTFFYVGSLYFLIKEKDKYLKNIGLLGYVGILALIINAINLFPFLTKNFNIAKGDPMKSHLFSFLLVFTFIYFLLKINLHKNIKVFVLVFSILNLFFFTMAKGVSINEIKSSSYFLNKIHIVTPCALNDLVESKIDFSDSWCSDEEISLSICKGNYDPAIKPYQEDNYLVFPKDPKYTSRDLSNGADIVNVGNYFECINYANGGFYIRSAQKYFNNSNSGIELTKVLLVLSLLVCFLPFFYERGLKTKRRKV